MPAPPFVILTVLVNGAVLDGAIPILAVDVEKEVNRLPAARLTLGAPGPAAKREYLLGGGPFAVGDELVIKLRLDGVDHSLFTGLVTGLSMRADAGLPSLTVEAKDRAIRLTGQRRSAVWEDMTDSEVIARIINLAKLGPVQISATQPRHGALVQHDASDWDFVLTRADAQGLLVKVENGIFTFSPMAVSGAPTRVFNLASGDILSAELAMDASRQHPSLSGAGWDSSTLAAETPMAATLVSVPQGGVGVSAVGSELGYDAATLRHFVPMNMQEVKTWASARLARDRLGLLSGRVRTVGLHSLALLEVATLSGFGKSFNGEALVTGLRHRVDEDGFKTDVQFGLAGAPLAARLPDLQEAPAGALLPGVGGLQLGTVAPYQADPEQASRIRVRAPGVGAEGEQQLWARVASPDAGLGRGVYFRPEEGDEVVLGFIGQDPRHPVVLGRLYGAVNTPPAALADDTANNQTKGVVTRSGAALCFTDTDKPVIEIKTPGGGLALFDDAGGLVKLADQNGNVIVMDKNGVTITSVGTVTIEGKGAVAIKGDGVDITKA